MLEIVTQILIDIAASSAIVTVIPKHMNSSEVTEEEVNFNKYLQ